MLNSNAHRNESTRLISTTQVHPLGSADVFHNGNNNPGETRLAGPSQPRLAQSLLMQLPVGPVEIQGFETAPESYASRGCPRALALLVELPFQAALSEDAQACGPARRRA